MKSNLPFKTLLLKKTPADFCICLALCFVTSLLACLAQYQWSAAHAETNLALVFDSGHYLHTAHLIAAPLHDPAGLAAALSLDGPILPGAAALVFCTLGKLTKLPEYILLTGLQSVFHALSAAFLFLLADQAFASAKSYKWPLICALLWAANPVAVLATQRFLSENLTAALTLLVVYLAAILRQKLVEQDKDSLPAISVAALFGLVCTLLLFVKTGLVVGILACSIYLFHSSFNKKSFKKIFLTLLCVCIGGSFVVLPWALVTKNLTGEMLLLPQRAPVLNLFVGWNFANDGFSTLPVAAFDPRLQKAYTETGSAPLAVAKLILHVPAKAFSLTLRKLTRLYGLPWNDFRRTALLLSPKLQQYLHQFILVSALAGLCLAFAADAPPAMILAALMWLAHSIFLLFETIPRYAFSSYPLLILFALYFGRHLYLYRSGKKSTAGQQTIILPGLALILIVILANQSVPHMLLGQAPASVIFRVWAALTVFLVFAIVFYLVKYFEQQEANLVKKKLHLAVAIFGCIYAATQMTLALYATPRAEWEAKLEPGDVARRKFRALEISPPYRALLLIDGTRAMQTCQVTVNGHNLSAPVKLAEFYPGRREQNLFAEQVIALMGRSSADLRQWWAVPVPLEALKSTAAAGNIQETHQIDLTATEPVRLYGQYDQYDVDPGYLFVSPGKIWTSNDSFEWRAGPPFSNWKAVQSSQHEQASTLIKPGQPIQNQKEARQKGSWRIYLAVDHANLKQLPESDFDAAGVNIY